MSKSTRSLRNNSPPDPRDRSKFDQWLVRQPRNRSSVIAARAALRALPIVVDFGVDAVLPIFQASSISRFAGKYPNYEPSSIIALHYFAARFDSEIPAVEAANAAIAASNAFMTTSRDTAAVYAVNAYTAAAAAIGAYHTDDPLTGFFASVGHDALRVYNGDLSAEKLAGERLWPHSVPRAIADSWLELKRRLHANGSHWQVWVDWYENGVLQEPFHAISEAQEAAFTDFTSKLPWDDGAEAVNNEIARQLRELRSDPAPIENIPSPIAITLRPDGRIEASAGEFSAPTLPAPLTPVDHTASLAACRKRAEQLLTATKSPTFQGRKEYTEALAAYLDWLPSAPGVGNILLADGEARILNKFFVADEEILATGFAGRLSVLLEDHIALRTHYPELERHYEKVRTGRVVIPLSRDAVEGIRKAIHENTPKVFHDSVSPAMDETAKPVPDTSSIPFEDKPPFDPGRPKPPKDPIAEADLGKSRNLTFASAANRIWEVLQKGKDLPKVIEGWQKAYDDIKPHIGQMLDWLHRNWPGGGDGMPPLPPMGSA